MILIPFFLDLTHPIRIGVFQSEGGRSFWQIGDTHSHFTILALLIENGFPVVSLETIGQIVYARIDHTQLKLNDFFLLSDVDPKTSDKDVWQIFRISSRQWITKKFKQWFVDNSHHFMGGSGHLNYQDVYD